MTDSPSAIDLRRWAEQCAERARSFDLSEEDRNRLMKMSDSLLALADNADWLAGMPASETLEAAMA